VHLLISVADAREAYSAVAGGAVIVDAKEPAEGPLGAVLPHVLREIMAAVRGACPISVAMGDAPLPGDPFDDGDPEEIVFARARAAARAGADYVKLGFARTPSPERAAVLTAAAVRGARAGSAATRVVAVAYVDAERVRGIPPGEIIGVATRGGAAGVLLDTADKQGGGLFDLMDVEQVATWVREAERAGLIPALAGKLDDRGVATARVLGAHVAGVRGAACRGGRDGPLLTRRVRELAAAACGLGPLPIDSWLAARR
jgi:uncharacterized protein (UPF0264 family)